MVEVIPSILTDSPNSLREMLDQALGVAGRVHVDIIDGVYADNRTISPETLEGLKAPLVDYHLMVNNPVVWIERCVLGQADRIVGHIEMMESQKEFIDCTHRAGSGVGLAVDLDTPVGEVESGVLCELDVVIVMSVKAGHGGQRFDSRALDKIEELDRLREDGHFKYRICDDGGIVFNNVGDVRCRGADEVNIGNRIFQGDLEKNIKDYQKAVYK